MLTNRAVALRIARLLREKKMTQYRLERKSGVLHSTMTNIINENNKSILLNTLIMIGRGFDMTIQEFLDDPLFADIELEVE